MINTSHLSVDSRNPQAWIAIQKNRLKVHSGQKVFLNDGQEFQIELHNPTQSRLLVKFQINGRYPSHRGLILNPGQRYFLDRFLDVQRRLTFSTYEVEDNSESKEAIAKNGLLRIEFYEEAISYYTNSFTFNNSGTNSASSWNNCLNNDSFSGFITTTSISSNSAFTTGRSNISVEPFSCLSSHFSSTEKSLETGRIEEGKNSNQSFSEGHGNFNSWTSFVTEIKLLPASRQEMETSEIKSYCTECGTKKKKSAWKFCPQCGNKW